MASTVLSKGEQNFIRFVKICLDVLKQPLADILASEIQPADLYNKIKNSGSLLNGKNKLAAIQLKICFLSPPAIPDYTNFDVTLLYKLIRNLCPSLEPTNGWGKDPVDADIQIGDDIERLRLFRNNNVHNDSSEITDIDFEIILKKLKSVFQRIQNHMTSKGYKVNYEEKMTIIKHLDLGDEPIHKYKIEYLLEYTIDSLKQADDREVSKISIEGPKNVLCGNIAKYIALTTPENIKGWTVTWQKLLQCSTQIRINSSTEKYFGSNEKNLVIQSVCKEDEGGYQAILSKDSKANISVLSNVIFLQAVGGIPIFDVWDVTAGIEGITIRYGIKKRPPYVNEIKWIKDGVPIFNRNRKYNGGELNDGYFTIASPTIEDRGNYSCVIKNAVGSVQKDVRLDVPNAEISTEQQIYFGSETRFTSRIASCPSHYKVEWQQSHDRKTFKSIIISKPKYFGSSCNPKSPLLIIPKVTFEDKLYYRLVVWNMIGEQYSNTVFLDVKGSPPNITISQRTCVSDRSITLIGNVFLYGNLPAVQNVFWTKNGEKLDTQGSGGRYTEVTVDNPSLTIFEVNEYDAGSYQLTATNAVGSTTSDFLILDIPDVSMARPEKKNGRFCFTVTIQSIPAPDFAQWSIKDKSSDTFIPIDENVEEFKGTSHTLPRPVLVVNPKTNLDNYIFQIEIRNFIGCCKKITPGEEGSDDTFTNENGNGCLSEFYLDGGAGLKFAKLFDDIAEHFPEKKTRRLKDFIRYSQKVKDMTLFAQTVSARDCLEILCDQKLFTPWDVIFIQFLLKNTECLELFQKCVAYAEAHRALCFFEKLPENDFKNVQFHVRANLSCYTPVETRKIQETLAAIVGCSPTEIVVAGYRHSSSFLAVLSVEKKHVRKLLAMEQHGKDELSRLKIDYFIVDFITVYLQEIRGVEYNDEYPIMLRKLCKRSNNERIEEKQLHLFLLPRSNELSTGESAHERALLKNRSKKLDSDISDIYNVIKISSISVSAKEVKHISCLMPNRFWVSDMKKVQEIDENGRILREFDIYFTLFGSHTLTKSGDLLFLKDNDVYMLTSNGDISNLFIHASVHFCIHSSRMNGDILIGDINIVTRYNKLGMKLSQIELDNKGNSLYVETIFITENTNGDIIVSDNGKKAVVATDKSGRHLFNYEGHYSQTTFHPGGICTDILGCILVCNMSSDQNVHLLDQKGRFLAHLLTKHPHDSDCPQALCVDSNHNLYVGYSNKNKINVYKYLTNDTLFEFYIKKSKADVKIESTERRRKSCSDLNFTHETNFEEQTTWARELNKEASDLLPSVPPIPPKKTIFKFDKHYEENISKTIDSDIRSKPYGDFNFTHLTSLDDQAIRSNKKPSYWLITIPPVPLKRQYCCFDAKKTEKTSDKTESAPPIPPRKQIPRVRSGDSTTNVKPFDSVPPIPPKGKIKKLTNEKDSDLAPPIPPRIQLSRIQSGDSNTKEKQSKSAPPVPPRLKLCGVKLSDLPTKKITSSSELTLRDEGYQSYSQGESTEFRSPSLNQSAVYEDIDDADRSYKKVQFHMEQQFLRKSRLMIRSRTIDTVSTIVGCHPADIVWDVCDESNNSVNLEIHEEFLEKLLSMTPEEKTKLRKLDIDYFIADFITVYLGRPKEIGVELHRNVTLMDEKTADRSKESYVNLDDNAGCSSSPRPSPISMLLKPFFALKGKPNQEDLENSTSGDVSSPTDLKTAIHTKRINVCTQGVKHISCLTSNRMWVSDINTIYEIDATGQILMKLDVKFGVHGRHTVTRDGNLLFLKNYSVYILTSNGHIRNLYISAPIHSCIHSSRQSSDIFIGSPNGVNRYSESSRNLLKIQVDDKGENIYGRPIYITENTNGDIIVSDEQRKAIIVVDRIGQHRFNYRGNHSSPGFNPRGVCTNVLGHILVCNLSYHDHSVHILDQNGYFLATLLTKHRSEEYIPQDVYVDDKHNVYVGCGVKSIIDVYKYLK